MRYAQSIQNKENYTSRHHLVGSGWIIPNPGDPSTLQERQSNCVCRGTSEEATPPVVPGSPDAPSQDPRFRTGLLAGQTPEESFRFFRPPASNFARDHHHPHATVPALEFRVSPLVVSACFSQGDAVCFVLVPAVNPVPVRGRSRASWLLPKRDNPSATTSSLLPSVETCARSKSRSRKKIFVETRAPPSRQIRATAPLQIPCG